jgi:hypothetical protein
MDSKTQKKNNIEIQKIEASGRNSVNLEKQSTEFESQNIESLCDENLTTLKKIHAILLNCINLSKNQKIEFCESERYFMKLYLKKLQDKKSD